MLKNFDLMPVQSVASNLRGIADLHRAVISLHVCLLYRSLCKLFCKQRVCTVPRSNFDLRSAVYCVHSAWLARNSCKTVDQSSRCAMDCLVIAATDLFPCASLDVKLVGLIALMSHFYEPAKEKNLVDM